MDNRVIQVPGSVLLDPDQTAATTVIWMALRLHPASSSAELAVRTGLSRHTVLSGLGHVEASQGSGLRDATTTMVVGFELAEASSYKT